MDEDEHEKLAAIIAAADTLADEASSALYGITNRKHYDAAWVEILALAPKHTIKLPSIIGPDAAPEQD